MAEWSKDHVVAVGYFNTQHFELISETWLKWTPDEAFGWKRETAGWEGRRVVCGKPAPLRLYPPPMSVKEWWVGPREQVLNVPIACWWYELGNPNSRLLIDAWLCPHCFIGWLGREAGYGPTDWSAGALWIVSGTLFLRSSGHVQLCWRLVKGCHVQGPPAGSVRRAYVDWRGKRTCRVGQVFPYRVYINSNRRDSRIWATVCLWQPSHR
jgi:hypothetical protein